MIVACRWARGWLGRSALAAAVQPSAFRRPAKGYAAAELRAKFGIAAELLLPSTADRLARSVPFGSTV